MTTKAIVFLAFVALSRAGVLEVQSGWAQQPTIIKQVQPAIIKKVIAAEEPANYQFAYDVNDASTGDVHSQQEHAENGAIKGSYQLNDADGYVRIVSKISLHNLHIYSSRPFLMLTQKVDYTADDAHGFQATVRREPLQHVQHVKKIIAQPATITKFIQPAKVYAAPSGHGWA